MAAVVAISVGIPVGMLVRWFAESSSAGLSSAGGNLKYLLPATLTSVEIGVAAAVLAVVCSRYRSRLPSSATAGLS